MTHTVMANKATPPQEGDAVLASRSTKASWIGSLRAVRREFSRARRCPICDGYSRVLVAATTPSTATYAYCPTCWGVTEAAYAAWHRSRP